MRPVSRRFVALLALGAVACTSPAIAEVQLHTLFQDHAVLQREQPIKVWGTAPVGAAVTVALADRSASAIADHRGRWQAQLPPLPAGGPHELVLSDDTGERQRRVDVMVGDVWLCSGQSNMVLQVHRALDSRVELLNADHEAIRLFHVPDRDSVVAQDDFAAAPQWRKASAESVREFSAACYFFARELRKQVDVPMGLIAAAWGGSKIETWISTDTLRQLPEQLPLLEMQRLRVQQPAQAATVWGEAWERWWRELPQIAVGDEPWRMQPGAAGDWQMAPAALGPWERWGVPALADYDGMVWYRTELQLDRSQARQAAVLSLGQVDEIDQSWLNEHRLGLTSRPDGQSLDGTSRRYWLPPGTLRAGRNVLVVNVLDTYSEGGLRGAAQDRYLELADGQRIALSGPWRYRIAGADLPMPPRPPWHPTGGLATLYNGMIAPLGDTGLRGVLWYQGESNTTQPQQYSRLLSALMQDWRGHFGESLPFLIVQLANLGTPPTAPEDSNWALLREAQRLSVLNDPRAALVVAIDLGERHDIHPANKQDVARRLAQAAQHLVYGEPVPPSGPAPLHAWREGAAVTVKFIDVHDELIAYGAHQPIGFELCTDAPDSCSYAQAQLQGDTVTLNAELPAAPTQVRYCWADSPVCTLYDRSHLPAGPFQLSIH